MERNWKMITENSVMYGLSTALLFAAVFASLSISGAWSGDIIFGVITGALSGMLISVVVGVIDQELACRKIVTQFGALTISNSICGFLAGALISTIIIYIMVQLVDVATTVQLRSIYDLPLCCTVGMPLGIIIGLLIGVSWGSK